MAYVRLPFHSYLMEIIVFLDTLEFNSMENVGVTMKPKHGMPCMAKWKNGTKSRTASKVGTFFFSGRAKKSKLSLVELHCYLGTSEQRGGKLYADRRDGILIL